MKPIGKYIVIKLIKEELKTESGLLLSNEDASNFRYKKGEVVKPGTDVSVINSGDVISIVSKIGNASACLTFVTELFSSRHIA